MARLKRMFIPGVPQHVIIRGNNRQDVFFQEADRYYFLGCLQEAALKHGLAVHAYVLMTNHVHVLATGQAPESIPRTFQSLGRRYVAHVNCIHGRTGTLWEGRYWSALVHEESYLINCQRYVEENPVRAGLVRDPAAYRWSSHRCLALGARDDVVTPHPRVAQLLAAGREEYRRLFLARLDASIEARIRDATRHGWAVGDDAFLQWAADLCNRRVTRSRAAPGHGKRQKPSVSDPEGKGGQPGQGTARSWVPG